MIFTDRTIIVQKGASSIDDTIVLYRGDKEVEIRFTLNESYPFKFSGGAKPNIIEKTGADFGQLVIKTPNDLPAIFSEVVPTSKDKIIFKITATMIDEITEVGYYTFQIRLFDKNMNSRATLPEVVDGIEIREPIAAEDVTTTNEVGEATVGYAITTAGVSEDAFDSQGNYNKTTWETGDRITATKLNKIETGIDEINKKVASGGTGGEVDLSGYVTKETGNANQITFADGQTFQAKLDAGTLKGEKGDTGERGPQGEQGPQGPKGDPGSGGGSSIDDTTVSETTTYSGNKIESIKENLISQIDENKNNLTNFKNELNSYEYICPLATGNIDVDTQNVSNFFNVCIEKNYTNVLIPKGTYKISSGFDITRFQYGARISAFGAIFDVQSECDYVLRLKKGANYWNARRLTIQGLEIKGNFKAQNGIEINGVLEWCLQGVRIHNCRVGLALESTYYGEMNSECVIEGCLIGIQHRNNGSSTSEVNTIDYHNVKVNAGAGSLVVRKKWFAVNEGESDTDYDVRCAENEIFQVGVQIECTTWMTKFYGLIIEGVDYGYYSCKHSTGGYYAHFIIEKNYFELIKKSPIRLETLSGPGYITAKISDNHYYDYLPIIIGNGTFEIFGNTRFGYTVPLETNISRPSYVKTDSSTIVDKTTAKYTLIKEANRPPEKYLGQSYVNMGVNSNGIEAYLESNRTNLADGTSFYPIYSYTNKNIHISNPYSGIILTSANNKLYMIKVTETGELYTDPVNSKVSWVTSESQGRFTGKQYKKLLDMKSPLLKEGAQQFIEYPLYEYVYLEDGVPKVTWEKKKGITTAKEYYEASDKSIFSFVFYDYNADVSYYNSNNSNNIYTGNWNFRGNTRVKSIQAIGTLEQRPIDPAIEDFIYYAGDEDKYYKWNNSTKDYSEWAPPK